MIFSTFKTWQWKVGDPVIYRGALKGTIARDTLTDLLLLRAHRGLVRVEFSTVTKRLRRVVHVDDLTKPRLYRTSYYCGND